MPVVRETYETKKQDILKAAQGLFARYGLAKTTLEDIANAVGMKKTSLYHYYGNKEAIFSEVITHEIGKMLSEARATVGRAEQATQKLLAYMIARVEYMRDQVNLHGLAAQVILEVRPLLEELYADLLQQEKALIKEIIEEGVADGEFRPCDTEVVADAVLTVIHSVELMAVQHASTRSRAEIDYDRVEQQLSVILQLIGKGLVCRSDGPNAAS